MKTIKEWFSELFDPQEFNDLNLPAIGEAFNDPAVRGHWLRLLLNEIRQINMEVDKRLLVSHEDGLVDLCARRKALQDVLEWVLSAKRAVSQEIRPNPLFRPLEVNLDRVTV